MLAVNRIRFSPVKAAFRKLIPDLEPREEGSRELHEESRARAVGLPGDCWKLTTLRTGRQPRQDPFGGNDKRRERRHEEPDEQSSDQRRAP